MNRFGHSTGAWLMGAEERERCWECGAPGSVGLQRDGECSESSKWRWYSFCNSSLSSVVETGTSYRETSIQAAWMDASFIIAISVHEWLPEWLLLHTLPVCQVPSSWVLISPWLDPRLEELAAPAYVWTPRALDSPEWINKERSVAPTVPLDTEQSVPFSRIHHGWRAERSCLEKTTQTETQKNWSVIDQRVLFGRWDSSLPRPPSHPDPEWVTSLTNRGVGPGGPKISSSSPPNMSVSSNTWFLPSRYI